MGQQIVLFHSVLGLRPAVRSWADRLRAAGHLVHTPDLFDGEVFDTQEEGMRKRDALGIPALMQRAQQSVADLPAEIVVAGFSMGAAAAELLAITRPGVRAAILMHGALPLAAMEADAWPPVPLQIHHASGDPLVDAGAVRALAAAARAANAPTEVYVYERGGHLFADPASPDHDAGSAELMLRRSLDLLARL